MKPIQLLSVVEDHAPASVTFSTPVPAWPTVSPSVMSHCEFAPVTVAVPLEPDLKPRVPSVDGTTFPSAIRMVPLPL